MLMLMIETPKWSLIPFKVTVEVRSRSICSTYTRCFKLFVLESTEQLDYVYSRIRELGDYFNGVRGI